MYTDCTIRTHSRRN